MDEELLAHGQSWEPKSREFSSLRSFLEAEHRAHRSERESLYDRPVADRVASGNAIDGALFRGVETDGRDKLFVFTCPRNDSRFRPGTRVRLSRGDPRDFVAHLELVEDRYDGKKYILRFFGFVEDPKALESSEAWVLDEDVFDLLDVQLSILRAAEEEGLASWLEGAETRRAPRELPPSSLREGLSGSMREAFDLALRTPRWSAVQGPPGSGKTHLLARLALHFALEEGRRVLITAVSHQAIHQALGETYWVGRKMCAGDGRAEDLLSSGFYKLGAKRGTGEGLPEGVRPTFRLPKKKRPYIAGATIYAAAYAASTADRRLFDAVLFDEAGQAPLVLALGARLQAPEVVFIGDDAQLPPVVQLPPGEEADPRIRESALRFIRRCYGDPPMLEETRRLNRELGAVVSDCFYGAALSPTPEAGARTLRLQLEPSEPFAEVLRPDRSLVFVDVPHSGCRSVSEPEALWAAAIAGEARRCGLPGAEIGVIAPYRAQCNRIRFLLGGSRGIVCSTVERFQGQERELVVISLTSSNLRYIARLAAFLFSPNRLNVAVSRARTKVVLLGSRKALIAASEGAEDADVDAAAGLGVFRKMLARAYAVDGARIPPKGSAPGADASEVRDAGAEAFEPGEEVEHAVYGAGRVLSRSVQVFDKRREWVNSIRFNDGTVRQVIPRLSQPPMRRVR